MQEWQEGKRKEREALDRDYKASQDAKRAHEAALERVKQAREAVKEAKAAVRQAAKVVVDPPATVGVPTTPGRRRRGRAYDADS
jgi:hypothetical protein